MPIQAHPENSLSLRSTIAAALLAGLCAFSAGRAAAQQAPPPARYTYDYTHGNKMGLNVTNYGFFGNNLASRAPSLEYPLGSGLEHLVRAGIWVAARALPDSTDPLGLGPLRVTTGCQDGYFGLAAGNSAGTEFSPEGTKIQKRSSLQNSPNYSKAAVSEEDVLADYNDETPIAVTGEEPHTPMHIQVHLETYSWSFDLASSFVVMHFQVENKGPLLRNAYLAMYSQMVSNNENLYTRGWPPSSTTGPRSWFYSTLLDWVDSLSLVEEHFCAGIPCQTEAVNPYWAGLKYLGTRTGSPTAKLHFNWWTFSPANELRSSDVQRYGIMADTTPAKPTSNITLGKDSPIEFLSVGPFQSWPTDSIVSVDFAYACGKGRLDLENNARFAQLAFDLNYVLPKPPPSPRLHIVPGSNALDLYWDNSPDTVQDATSLHPDKHDFEGYRVYLGQDVNAASLLAQADLQDSVPPNTGLDAWRLPQPVHFPGDSANYVYHYKIVGLRDGFKYFAAVTSFDKGDVRVPSLESGVTQNVAEAVPGPGSAAAGITVFPNPFRVEARWESGSDPRKHYLWFAGLPARSHVRIYTLGGDLIKDIAFDAATYHGEGSKGLYDPISAGGYAAPQLSGSMLAWNLISDHDQAVGSGLYLYSVEDLSTGKRQVGRFVIMKADRQ